MLKRRIGSYTGAEKGPLVVVLAGVHGNEPAGIVAIQELLERLAAEPLRRPDFQFKGRLVGLIGNVAACQTQERFIDLDLNRCLLPNILSQYPPQTVEAAEAQELVAAVRAEIAAYQPDRVFLIDLHTTSASGGIFTIVPHEAEGLSVAVALSPPVVLGLLGPIGGSTLHFFSTQNLGVPTIALGFEGGQHRDKYAPARLLAFVLQVLRAVGCVSAEAIEYKHEALLTAYSAYLPKVVQLVAHHKILPTDGFKMLPGFDNFQFVRKGQALAQDHRGLIFAPDDCRILMPLYQAQGSDGFFLVKEVAYPTGEK